nr:olfactory receptor 7G2-like [Castor canadensis]
MEAKNRTVISEFLLLGLSNDLELKPLIFSIFLSMYLVTMLGNLIIILTISYYSHLHTPMYFFLSNLSANDICFSTSTITKMLLNIQKQDQNISYIGCISQVCFVSVFGGMEYCLIAVMAYVCYVAICHPLRYIIIMNLCLCVMPVLISLFISTAVALLHSLMVLRLSFCTEPKIPHFFCELGQIKLSYSDPLINNLLIFVTVCVFGGVPVTGIIFSYVNIVFSLLRMPSSIGKHKAFSTCGSHLSVVSLFYGTGFGVYISSAVTDSSWKSAVASVMYSVVPQILNPFIYSLRNKEMKEALRKLISMTTSVMYQLLWAWVSRVSLFEICQNVRHFCHCILPK